MGTKAGAEFFDDLEKKLDQDPLALPRDQLSKLIAGELGDKDPDQKHLDDAIDGEKDQ